MIFWKKWGILIKKESGSLEFTGLEIPRDYNHGREENEMNQYVTGVVIKELREKNKMTLFAFFDIRWFFKN